MKTLFISSFLILQYCVFSLKQSDCESKETCSECLQQISCLWCIQELNTTSNAGTHCIHSNSEDSKRCSIENLVNPQPEYKVIASEPLRSSLENVVQIKPQQVEITIRKEEEYTFHFQYKQAKNYPVDLYYIMDLSSSMEPHRKKLGKLGRKLAFTMSQITTNFRLGFGSFVDKVDLPFVSTVKAKLERPCSHCVTPYSFKNHMSLTNELSRFETEVSNANVSGNLDAPEGGLDAIMQAIVCKKEIGWRPKARHLLVFSTDDEFHIAGDGKLLGVVEPNDAKCHMKDNKYTDYLIYDYPSVSKINYIAKANNINLIFAIVNKRKRVFNSYKLLSEKIENSNIGALDGRSDNVVKLVLDNYNRIVDSVTIDIDSTENVDVKISTSCKHPRERGCSNIHVGEVVNFTATIKPLSCERNSSTPGTIRLKPRAIDESLIINLYTICSCNCEHPQNLHYVSQAEQCMGFGNLECGVCKCDEGHLGRRCECDGNHLDINNETNCMEKNSKEVCSGLGSCKCGKCECHPRPDPKQIIYGKYCQCDNYSCNREDGVLCSGKGSCNCGNCNCFVGWTGLACECSDSNSTCIDAETNDKVCSGHGSCSCGKCQCEDQYTGVYCEECPTCPGRCDEVLDCVECVVFGEGNYNSYQCKSTCSSFSIETVDQITEENIENGAKVCRGFDTKECKFIYTYSYKDSKELLVLVEKEKICQPNILAWTLGVIGSIVLAGFIMLLIWKVVTSIHDKREYVKFENERKNSKWHKLENPLYKDATTTFQNPYYKKRVSTASKTS